MKRNDKNDKRNELTVEVYSEKISVSCLNLENEVESKSHDIWRENDRVLSANNRVEYHRPSWLNRKKCLNKGERKKPMSFLLLRTLLFWQKQRKSLIVKYFLSFFCNLIFNNRFKIWGLWVAFFLWPFIFAFLKAINYFLL